MQKNMAEHNIELRDQVAKLQSEIALLKSKVAPAATAKSPAAVLAEMKLGSPEAIAFYRANKAEIDKNWGK